MNIKCLVCSINMKADSIVHYPGEIGIDICDLCAGKVHSAYESWHGGKSIQPRIVKRKKKISPKLALSIYRRDGFRCKCCGLTGDLTVDHIIPESKGGGSDEANLQTLCRSCNSKKGVSDAVV